MLIPGDIRLQPLANLLFQWPWGWGRFTGHFPRPTIQGLAWKQQKTSHDKLQLIWKTPFWSTQKCNNMFCSLLMWIWFYDDVIPGASFGAPRMYGSYVPDRLAFGAPKTIRSKKLIVKEGLEWKKSLNLVHIAYHGNSAHAKNIQIYKWYQMIYFWDASPPRNSHLFPLCTRGSLLL